ncbi:F-box only protein 7 [Clupea harengus]|uniref:F-box only protein 7 n=1 Tax=Clupea harengus TaxID=7950 RepID=A0A6P3WF07_CLUHA|nr:F-box only protein 7 [Clupea harengus]
MKLRVRVGKQTSRLDLEGDQATLTELTIQIKEIFLPSCEISPDTEFGLSLNGKEPLSDTGQTLASCGIVSGDLICVILPQSCPAPGLSLPTTSQRPTSSSKAPHKMQEPSTSTPPQRSAEPGPSTSQRSSSNPDTEVDLEMDEEAISGPFIPDPMLCSEAEEGKVPHSLELLHHGSQSRSSNDCLMVALHLIMLETGFLPQGSEGRTSEMPTGWRGAGGMYRLQYIHPLCENSLAVVVSVPMGSMLVTNATLKMNDTVDNARKLELKSSSFVTEHWAGENAEAVYKDLRKLSRVFKDQLVYPLMASARQAMGLPELFGLPVLPLEMLLRILRLLDVASVNALSAVSRDLRSATEDPSLWRHIFHRDFRAWSSQRTEPRDTDWKELYKTRFKQRKEMRSFKPSRHPCHIPPIYPLHPLPTPPVPLPLYPPGIIGGEYDQRPGFPHGLLPRPRYDPIGPLPGQDPGFGLPIGRRSMRPSGNRPADIRRGFI